MGTSLLKYLLPALLSSALLGTAALGNVAIVTDENAAQRVERNSTETKAKVKNADVNDALAVNNELVTLLTLSDVNLEQARAKFTESALTQASLNVAEHYLFLLLQANFALADDDFTQSIALLTEAESLSEFISDEQLGTPLFFALHQQLAQSYALTSDFEKAFAQKKSYLKKYRAFQLVQKAQTVEVLKQKHKTAIKSQENQLLENQNKIEALKLKEMNIIKVTNKRNAIMLVALAVIFALLLFRQIGVRHRLKLLAQTDSLTQLMNRRTFFDRGLELTEAADQNDAKLSVVLLDIDYFKKINDKFGHLCGDQVLKIIALLGNETMRSRDVFARLGGEEFVAILPEANLDEAKAIAERLREKIVKHDFAGIGLTGQVSASFGVAALDQNRAFDFDNLVLAADQAMHVAKAQGKNQVVCYDLAMADGKQAKNC